MILMKYQYAKKILKVKFPKISFKMKNFKTFRSTKQRSAWRKLISLPTRLKLPTSLERKFSNEFTRICRHLFSKDSENAVLGVWKWYVQMFLLTPTKKMFLAVLRLYFFYNVEWADVHKMSRVFWAKLYCKVSDIFC